MKYANMMGYSDVEPFEVIREVSAKCLEVRAMKCEAVKREDLVFIPGGFSAVCVNQRDQEWKIESDPEGYIYRIRLGKKGWKNAYGAKFSVGDAPIPGGFLLSKRCIKWSFNVKGRQPATCPRLPKLSTHAGSYRNVKHRHWSIQRKPGGVITKSGDPVCTPRCGNCSKRK